MVVQQQYGVKYCKTFSTVVEYMTIQLIIRGCQSWTINYLSSICCCCEYYALADNFRLSQLKQPNFDYPQMHNNQKIIFVISKRIDPLNAKQLSCSQKAVNAATEGHDYEAQLWGVL